VDFEQLITELHHVLVALMCATVRIQVALAIIPLFSRQNVPGLVRAAIGVGLSLVLVPPVLGSIGQQMPQALELGAIVLKEAFIGLLIGYSVAALFWAIEAVGFFIDNQRGASIASTLDPLTGNDSSPLGILFNQAFLVYFLVAGGFGVFMTMMYSTYGLWPVMHYFPTVNVDSFPVFAGMFERVIRLALLLSAPVIVAMLLAELGLALVSRFAPQLQVFFLAMPIKCGMAFFVLVVYLPTLFDYIREEMLQLAGLPGLLSEAFQ